MAVGLSDAILCIRGSIHVQKQMKQLIFNHCEQFAIGVGKMKQINFHICEQLASENMNYQSELQENINPDQ